MTETRRCPQCKQVVHVKADGTLGKHRVNRRCEQFDCDGGTDASYRPPNPGRRIVITVHATVPAGWSRSRLPRWARALVSHRLDGAAITDVTVVES